MRSICASPEGAATAVDQGTDACIAGLPDTCVEATCGCECTATGSSCS
jgi:hypothetical protein